MKKIIWSLFDSETAITQQLNSENHEVYSIGLASDSAVTTNFLNIDLSKKSCLKKLRKLPQPDIIFASPPCETWVSLSIGNVRFYERNYNEANLYWQKDFKPNNFAKKHEVRRLIGQKTAYWTMRIIREFNPTYWFIENGSSSLIFDYLAKFHNLKGYKNLVRYNCYDSSFSVKPTFFYSNKKINLKKFSKKTDTLICVNKKGMDKVNKTIDFKALGYSSADAYIKDKKRVKETYCERSEVPIGIYKDILKQIETPVLTLF